MAHVPSSTGIGMSASTQYVPSGILKFGKTYWISGSTGRGGFSLGIGGVGSLVFAVSSGLLGGSRIDCSSARRKSSLSKILMYSSSGHRKSKTQIDIGN